MKKTVELLGTAILGGVIALGGYKLSVEKSELDLPTKQADYPELQTLKASYKPEVVNTIGSPTDFTEAATKTVHAVVHVKNTSVKTQEDPFSELFFGPGNGVRKYKQIGTGSGVIISPDGYIITNNHVIRGAEEIEITLNNRKKLMAKVIGADEKDDIALLKVNAESKLPYIPFGNSDNVKVGEWVLAVGNPYNLTSTVTAGIVSAKGRDLKGNGNIDSFIQTDAAVNPGNSGGALVNTRGELIGINSAISTRTGSFIGYSFAIPSNIAKKIIDDLMEYGNVQEAILGIDIDQSKDVDGVLISGLSDNGGAKKAGLRPNDIIIKVNEVKIDKFSQLKGQLTAKRPGEKISVTVMRDGKEIVKTVRLGKKDFVQINSLGLVIKNLSKKELKKFKLKGGVKIVQNANRNLQYYGVKKGYIITKINRKTITDIEEAKKLLLGSYNNNSPLYIEVLNLQGQIEHYAF